MIEQLSNSVTFYAFFVASKLGKAGLTDVTVNVWRGSTGAHIVMAASATEVDSGLYKYTLSDTLTDIESEYVAVFNTADTSVDQRDIPALWVVGRTWVERINDAVTSRASATQVSDAKAVIDDIFTATGNLDVAVSSRLASASYTAPPSAAANADAVWDELLAGHAGAGSAGAALTVAGGATDPLENPVPGTYAQGTAGAALGRIGVGRIEVASPVSTDGAVLTLVRGDDYAFDQGREIAFSFPTGSAPDLTGVTSVTLTVRLHSDDSVVFSIKDLETERVVGSGAQFVAFEPASTDTDGLVPGVRAAKFDVQAVLDSKRVTLKTGRVTVVEDQTRP